MIFAPPHYQGWLKGYSQLICEAPKNNRKGTIFQRRISVKAWRNHVIRTSSRAQRAFKDHLDETTKSNNLVRNVLNRMFFSSINASILCACLQKKVKSRILSLFGVRTCVTAIVYAVIIIITSIEVQLITAKKTRSIICGHNHIIKAKKGCM